MEKNQSLDNSKQDCIDAIKWVADEIGHSPSQREYKEQKRDSEPSKSTIRRRIGSWNKAKQQAGLETRLYDSGIEYSEDDYLEALQRVSTEIGHSPSVSEYKEHYTDSEPPFRIIRNEFGSWNKAKRRAGLKILCNRKGKYSEQDCIDAIKRVADEIGHSPSQIEYKEHYRNSEPSVDIIKRKTGWNEVKQQAGLKTEGYSEKEILNAIQRVSNKVGHSSSIAEYNKHKKDSEPALWTINNNMGSWNRAKEQAGLETTKKFDTYTKEECFSAIQRITKQLGHSPSLSEYKNQQKESEPSVDTIQRRFKSWNDFKRLCSLATYGDGVGVNYPYGSSWYSSRKQVLNRDECCVNCGLTLEEHKEEYERGLDIHHIYKLRSFYSDLTDEEIQLFENDEVPERLRVEVEKRTAKANHLSNLVLLCRECHLKKIEPLPVEEQVELLGIDMPKVTPDSDDSQERLDTYFEDN